MKRNLSQTSSSNNPSPKGLKVFLSTSVKFDMSVPQRCVGPPVTSPQRSSNAPWMQDTKDMGLRWTCECVQTRTTQEDMWTWQKKNTFPSSHCRWSSGVIMYTLLAGSPPFWHRKQMLMLRMILAGTYDFSSPEWEDRSDTVKDLVGHLWKRDESAWRFVTSGWIKVSVFALRRSPGCWWWTQSSDSQLRTFSTTRSFPSTSWMRCESSVHTGGSRWASDPSDKVLQQTPLSQE